MTQTKEQKAEYNRKYYQAHKKTTKSKTKPKLTGNRKSEENKRYYQKHKTQILTKKKGQRYNKRFKSQSDSSGYIEVYYKIRVPQKTTKTQKQKIATTAARAARKATRQETKQLEKKTKIINKKRRSTIRTQLRINFVLQSKDEYKQLEQWNPVAEMTDRSYGYMINKHSKHIPVTDDPNIMGDIDYLVYEEIHIPTKHGFKPGRRIIRRIHERKEYGEIGMTLKDND